MRSVFARFLAWGCLLAAACSAAGETRVVSVSPATQAVVIRHEGRLVVLRAADRKSSHGLRVERVDSAGAELRFSGLQVADVIARVHRGDDLAAMRARFDQPVPIQPVPVAMPLPERTAVPPKNRKQEQHTDRAP